MEGKLEEICLRLKESSEKQLISNTTNIKLLNQNIQNITDFKETVLSEIKLNTN